MHPTGSPIVGSAVAPLPLGSVMPPPPGLPGFVDRPCGSLHSLRLSRFCCTQCSSSRTIVGADGRKSTTRAEKGKGVGELSDITDSTNRAMEVDEGGAPIRKAEAYVPMPAIDGTHEQRPSV